jgi:hypothetical protein
LLVGTQRGVISGNCNARPPRLRRPFIHARMRGAPSHWSHAQHQAVRSQEASIRCTHRGPQSQTARMPAGTRRRPSWLPIWAAAVGWLAAAAGGRVLTAGDNRGLWVCV